MNRLLFGFLCATAWIAGGPAARAAGRCPSTQSDTLDGAFTTTGRFTLDGNASKCGGVKAFPGANAASKVRYKAYTYYNYTSADACVTATVTATSGEVQAAAYLGQFSTANPAQDYLGDPGASASALTGSTKPSQTFSFNVPAQRLFTVLIEETAYNAGAAFTLALSGCGEIMATGIYPSFGPTSGGGAVTIYGEGFTPGTVATVGGAPLAQPNDPYGTWISGVTAAHAAGPVDVVVTDDRGVTATLKNAFTYVARAASTVALAAPSPAGAVAGQPVTLTATVSGSNPPGTLDGKVMFKDGAKLLGEVALGSAAVASLTTAFDAGAHNVTALYEGGTYFNPSTSTPVAVTVGKATSQLTAIVSANPVTPGTSVTFTATVSAVSPGSGSPTGSVDFSEGGKVLATVPLDLVLDQAQWSTSSLAAGAHTITASYSGDADFAASKGDVAESVDLGATNILLNSSANPADPGTPITFSVAVSSLTQGAFTGNVQLTIDGVATPPVAVDANGRATRTEKSLGVGSHSVSASYAGDANHQPATADLIQQVRQYASSVSLDAPSRPTVYETQTLTASVTGSTSGPAPTGPVTFVDSNGSIIGVGTLGAANGASLATTIVHWMPTQMGYQTISVSYGGDANYASSYNSMSVDVVAPAYDAGTPDAGADDAGTGPRYDAGTWPTYDAGAWPTYDAGDGWTLGNDGYMAPTPTTSSSDCSCRAAGVGGQGSLAGLALGGVAVVLLHRRRRRAPKVTGRT